MLVVWCKDILKVGAGMNCKTTAGLSALACGIVFACAATLRRAIVFGAGPLLIFACVETQFAAEAGAQTSPKAPKTPVQSLVRRADYYRDHGEIEKALTLYSQAIQLDSKSANAFVGRALVYEEFGKLDRALADFTAATKIGDITQKSNWLAIRKRADLNQSLHRYKEAIDDYGKIIKAAPTDGLYFSRGSCYLKLNNGAQAVKDFDMALKIGKKRASIYKKRGDAYFLLEQNNKALADYDMALKLDPEGDESKDGNENLHRGRAEIYKRLGKHDLAKTELQRAAQRKNANLDLAPFSTYELRAPRQSK